MKSGFLSLDKAVGFIHGLDFKLTEKRIPRSSSRVCIQTLIFLFNFRHYVQEIQTQDSKEFDAI